jgi:hypothetical protein
LQKITKVHESKAVQFRAEFFNALEHAQFNNPRGIFTSGNFGRVTSAKAGRIGQMSLKVPVVKEWRPGTSLSFG